MMRFKNLNEKNDSKISQDLTFRTLRRGGSRMRTLNYCFYKNGIEHDFEYGVDESDIEKTLQTIVGNDIKVDETNIDELFDDLKDEIAIHYESKAYAEFEDEYAYQSDPYSYRGVSRADFA